MGFRHIKSFIVYYIIQNADLYIRNKYKVSGSNRITFQEQVEWTTLSQRILYYFVIVNEILITKNRQMSRIYLYRKPKCKCGKK